MFHSSLRLLIIFFFLSLSNFSLSEAEPGAVYSPFEQINAVVTEARKQKHTQREKSWGDGHNLHDVRINGKQPLKFADIPAMWRVLPRRNQGVSSWALPYRGPPVGPLQAEKQTRCLSASESSGPGVTGGNVQWNNSAVKAWRRLHGGAFLQDHASIKREMRRMQAEEEERAGHWAWTFGRGWRGNYGF